MTAWPPHPVVHEIYTWVWLTDLEHSLGRAVTLASVPDEVWDEVARPGIDAVWLMGVWTRSEAGAEIARRNPAMRADAQGALPDLIDDEVVGSAYCIADYHVDPRLGGDEGLRVARAALAARGARLVLDLVPNHLAPDHPWVRTHPERFVRGTAQDLADDPASFIELDGEVFACGRDPYFPAWPEVVQLDTSNADLRAAMAELVASLATRCDALRCDMAMLALDDVFTRTWGARATGGSAPDDGRGYWPPIIEAAKAANPDLAFWAEAYWDLEPVLVEQGFDACYDKRLYDRLVLGGSPAEVRAHLGADAGYQRHMVRFVENHDEPRAASLLGDQAHLADLTAVLTLPGVALLHEGEADGRRVHVPVTLARRPVEPLDPSLRAGVDALLDAVATGVRSGAWSLAEVHGWPDNPSAERLLAWTWTSDTSRHLVVVNHTDERADGLVQLPWDDLAGATATFTDLLTGEAFAHDGTTIAADGVYVARDQHSAHLFEVHITS